MCSSDLSLSLSLSFFRAVVVMFTERGFSTLLSDNIIDCILLFGNTLGGVITMLLAFAYAKSVGVSVVNTSMLSSLGFFTGSLMFTLTMSVVSSAVAAVCVCFAEKPEIFEVRTYVQSRYSTVLYFILDRYASVVNWFTKLYCVYFIVYIVYCIIYFFVRYKILVVSCMCICMCA